MTAFSPTQGPPPSALHREPTGRDRLGALGRALRPTSPQLVDAAFTAAVTAVALLGLLRTYDGWLWLVAGVAGLVVALVVTHVLLSLRLPGAAVLLVLAVLYVLLGGAVATREHLVAGFLPTGATITSLAHEAVFGWKELLTSLPPVDSRGPLMALPFLLGLVGAWAAYGLTRTWRTPALAAPVPVALLAVSILLGTQLPASVLVQGLGTALLVIGWVTLRARFARPSVDHGTSGVAGTDRSAFVWRTATTVVLLGLASVGGLLLGPDLPGDDGGRTVWRTALTPPYDVSQHPSPLAGYRQYTEPNPAKLYDQTLFTVSGLPDGTPMRIATLDSYDGSVWGAGTVANDGSGDDSGDATFQKVGSHIAAQGPGTPTTVTVTIPDKGWSDVWLPTVGTVTGLQFLGEGGTAIADDLRFNVRTNTGLVPSGLGGGTSYRLEADVPPVPEMPKDLDVGSGSIVDTQSIGFVDDKLNTWSANLTSPWGRFASAARTMLSDGAYTDGGAPGTYQNVYLPGHSVSRMTRFFKSSQLVGDDEQYASALALVGNRIGVPTRVVMGAIPEKGVVKGKDVHAWVEVQTEDGAWFPVLPQSFVPDRNKQPQQQQQRSEEKKVGAQVPPPVSSNPPSVLQGPDQAQNSTQIRKPAKPNPFNPENWPGWLQILAKFLGIPVVLLLLAYVVLRLSKRRRGRRRRTQGGLPLRIAGGWAEIVDTAQDLGMPLAPRLTRLEQASALDALLATSGRGIPRGRTAVVDPSAPVPSASARAEASAVVLRQQTRQEALRPDESLPSLRPLADTANGLVFAAADPTEEQVTTFWAQVSDVTKRLRKRASFWQRLRSDISLGGLRRDRRRTPASAMTSGTSGTGGDGAGSGHRGGIGPLRRLRRGEKVTA